MINSTLSLCDKANLKLFHLFSEMWEEYASEMSDYSASLKGEALIEREVYSMWSDSDTDIYFVILGEKCIGFLMTSVQQFNTDRTCNIKEFYINKGYRRQGAGKSAIGILLQTRKSRYHLITYRRNVAANHFWIKAFDLNGYYTISKRLFPDDCIHMKFAPYDTV